MDVDLTGGAKEDGPPGGAGGASPTTRKKVPFVSLIMGFLMWPLFFLGFSGAPACMGFEDPTLRAIEACPAAAAALGPPISRSYFGWSCGNAETSDAFGQASWTFPVSGANGSGSVDVVAEMRGGPWRILRANVETSAGTWEVVSCSGGAGSFSVTPTRLEATVSTVVGAAPAASGSACTIDISPGDGPFPCRVVVTCGGRALYGATSSTGFMQCTPDARGALTANDTNPSPSDNDPMFDLRVGDGQATLTDAGPTGTWVMVLSFAPPPGLAAPPAPAPPAVPAVPTSGVVSPPALSPPTPLSPPVSPPHVDRELHLLSPDAPSCIEMVSTCDARGLCTSTPIYIDCGSVVRVGDEDLRCNCDRPE